MTYAELSDYLIELAISAPSRMAQTVTVQMMSREEHEVTEAGTPDNADDGRIVLFVDR
jgi:hypothetical protein